MSNFVHLRGFPEYQINKEGVILGKLGRPLKERPNVPSRPGNIPYVMVALYKDKVRYDVYVHRLVLETFIGPCPSGMEARHLDSDHSNNRLSNLAWGTKAENGKDKIVRRAHCTKCGAELKGRNLLMVTNGKRRVRKCRSCHNARSLAAYHAKKSA